MATEDACKLFVAGLPDSINEEVLRQLFEAVGGTVVNVSLPKDRATGRARGFGFVTLASADEAEQARNTLDGSMQAGRSISVRPFSSEAPRRERSDTASSPPAGGGGGGSVGASGSAAGATEDRTLYVGNLPYDASQQDVEQLLDASGANPAVRIHLPQGPDGRMRGFGFVTMATAEDAHAALAGLRTADLRGRKLTVNIANRRGAGPGPGGGGGGGAMGGPRPAMGGDRSGARPPRRDAPEMDNRPAPDFEVSARPVEGRRARPTEKKKKKKAAAVRPAREEAHRRNRGGGNSWQNWDEVDDIDE